MIADMACPVCGTVTRFGWVAGANDPVDMQQCMYVGAIIDGVLCDFAGFEPQDIIDAGVEE